MPETIRKTKSFELYRGHGHTQTLYSFLRLPKDIWTPLGYTETWIPQMEKERLDKLSDDEFDDYCKKIKFQ